MKTLLNATARKVKQFNRMNNSAPLDVEGGGCGGAGVLINALKEIRNSINSTVV